MDTSTMEEKCEDLMNTVVECRKHFGEMCADYDQKISLMENAILNHKLDANSKCRSKPVNVPNTDYMYKQREAFAKEIIKRSKKIEDLKRRIHDTQNVVLQMKSDSIGKKLQGPLTAEILLAKAKNAKDS